MKSILGTLAITAALAIAGPAVAQENPRVGGAAMSAQMNIVENAMNSPIHTTLVAAVQAADLAGTLQSPGPFTVFAPTNSAFGDLPSGTVDTLLMPENKAQLVKVLTAHVVPGTLSAADIMERAEANGGSFSVTTVSGDALGIYVQNGYVYVRDENGGVARVTIADVNQSNGVIHVVNGVLVPQ
ncbi:fasciclin [Devosia pacifica]|uniref:Fasciclin n=2 Tax=Devosia pacifica TaxID=1335967 RepID=A0A918VUM2_9HYPH|nr:fasciclin domain-containing protein [Devosia pacifica]GHA24651.1 fasciclin [Devosia pacifica]